MEFLLVKGWKLWTSQYKVTLQQAHNCLMVILPAMDAHSVEVAATLQDVWYADWYFVMMVGFQEWRKELPLCLLSGYHVID